jgi:hypothetical protein
VVYDTRTVVMLAGLPSKHTLWNLYRRYAQVRRLLIRPQRRGSLWAHQTPGVVAELWQAQRPWGIWRRRKSEPRPARPTADEMARLRDRLEGILRKKAT